MAVDYVCTNSLATKTVLYEYCAAFTGGIQATSRVVLCIGGKMQRSRDRCISQNIVPCPQRESRQAWEVSTVQRRNLPVCLNEPRARELKRAVGAAHKRIDWTISIVAVDIATGGSIIRTEAPARGYRGLISQFSLCDYIRRNTGPCSHSSYLAHLREDQRPLFKTVPFVFNPVPGLRS